MVRIDQTQHPGLLIRKQCLAPHSLGVADGARLLGVSRQALNNVATGRSCISPEMAVRLAKAFGGSDEHWLQLQLAYDLVQIRKRSHTMNVTPVIAYVHRRARPQSELF